MAWGQLDYLIVDMPPGTGDAQLSLVQATQVDGAIIVTTPQEVSVGDALRGVKMFERVGVPVLGIVENMSWFECPHCGKPIADRSASGGGERLAKAVDLPLLGQVPLYPRVMEGGDGGHADRDRATPSSSAARALSAIADKVASLAASGAAPADAVIGARTSAARFRSSRTKGSRPSRSRASGRRRTSSPTRCRAPSRASRCPPSRRRC